ncbi:MAG: ATPase [Natronospirillum sp.]|uniref:ATPase n=1 Tax=Natronospirillum sp. TaxID=2812955 RepID=UPI0025FA7CF9|nr:ATPase [Natronospirillum sp.]MCH8552985.1 ATPase [Natronospirillum sp.]
MQIKTVGELIEWTRTMHELLAQCLTNCASNHGDERAASLLTYVAAHEAEMEKMVAEFEQEANSRASDTYVYDYIPHNMITAHSVCDALCAKLDIDEIRAGIFNFHKQINALYRTLLGTAVIPEATTLLQSLLDMEENQTKRLASQIGRMDDL